MDDNTLEQRPDLYFVPEWKPTEQETITNYREEFRPNYEGTLGPERTFSIFSGEYKWSINLVAGTAEFNGQKAQIVDVDGWMICMYECDSLSSEMRFRVRGDKFDIDYMAVREFAAA